MKCSVYILKVFTRLEQTSAKGLASGIELRGSILLSLSSELSDLLMEEKNNPEAKMTFELRPGDKLFDKASVKAAAAAANIEVAEGIVENLSIAQRVLPPVNEGGHKGQEQSPAVLAFHLNIETMAEYLSTVSSFQSPGEHLATLQVK